MMDPEMDDEVIADSEGEEEMLLPPPQPIKQTALPAPAMAQDSSHVSQFTENTPHRDSISNFTSAPATAASVPTAPKPRPRPKPNYKSVRNADGTSSANTSISTDSTLFPIRDSIQAPVSSAFGDSMILSIADRAKMRSRDAKSSSSRSASKEASSDPPTQSKKRPNVLSSDIIELSSEDELGLPPTKPRPKPKPRTKEQPRISSPQPSLPMPTSSMAPSILPPSDPPSSSAGLPPIVTLPEPYSSRAPSSSPFPSPVQSRKKKKKRVEEIDELDGGSDMPPPPPPFFASSSSEIAPQPQEVIDLSMLPPTIPPNAGDGAGASTAKKQTKPRKPRKKKGDDDDDGDDYVEGAESGKDKSQGKAKAPKEKKSKGKAKAKETLTDKAKSKGKQKEKEVFKSTEFVDDDEGAVMQNDAIVGWGGIDLFGDEIPGTQPGPVPQPIGNSDAMQSIQQVQSPTAEKRKSPSGDGDGRRGVEEPAEGPKKKKQKTSKKANSDNDPDLNASKKATTKAKGKDKGKGKRVVTSDDEELGLVDELNIEENSSKSQGKKSQPSSSSGAANEVIPDSQMQEQVLSLSTNAKENLNPVDRPADKPAVEEDPQKPQPTSLTSRYTIAPRVKSTPMSELIRRVNSLPGSPFHSPAQSGKRSSMTGTAYSPYLKSSKSLLSRIAPLHPNRKDPPPPLPPPPPRKKTKKELEMEEQWEEELVESVGGMTEWLAYSDQERQQMRRAKRDREMYGWED